MLKINLTLEGLKPGILLHNPLSMSKPKSGKKIIPSPEQEAADGCYWTEDGKSLAFPATNIHSSLIIASSSYRIGKRSIMPFIAGAIEIEPLLIPFNTKLYQIDTRRVVIQRQGILRSRPLIFPWHLQFTYIVEEIDFPVQGEGLVEVLKNITEEAGRRVGLGDFRPENRGWFGNYRIKGWKIIK